MLKKIVCAAFLASAAFAAVPAFEEASAELAQNNYDNALKLFEKSCYEEKNIVGCYAAGFININAYSQNSSEAKGFEQFSKACDAGDMDGCKSLGDIYENGQAGQETDYKKAMKFHWMSGSLQPRIQDCLTILHITPSVLCDGLRTPSIIFGGSAIIARCSTNSFWHIAMLSKAQQ